ncbi:MAG: aminopeptidase [Phycisphaerae bacterium]|nr:aminopeptidase [Phycisphaerae bacterium]
MTDPRIEKLADVLVNHSTRVKPGELVVISADVNAMPLVEATFAAVLKAGGQPEFVPRCESLREILIAKGSEAQVARPSGLQQWLIENAGVHIVFWSETNTKFLSRYDPGRVALAQQARKPVMMRFMQREAEGSLRWVGTQFPTHGAAQDAGMSLSQYENFVYGAGLLHLPDPAAAWDAIKQRQERVVDFLRGKKALRFRAPPDPAANGHDGTDLHVDVSAATWINCFGDSNFPDGEVFAGPTLPPAGFGADGHVNYTYPACYQGREVEGVRLVFKGGRVVDATAKRGEDFLHRMLDQDAGARNMGEIAIGTNYAITDFSRNILFDEKIGGTFHAAVGAGYPKSGNTNDSGLHWDMVCDLRPRRTSSGGSLPGGTIEADGETFHRDGKFLLPGWEQV